MSTLPIYLLIGFPLMLIVTGWMEYWGREKMYKEVWRKRNLFCATFPTIKSYLFSWIFSSLKECFHRRSLIVLCVWVMFGFLWYGVVHDHQLSETLLSSILFALAFALVAGNISLIFRAFIFDNWANWINSHPEEVQTCLNEQELRRILKDKGHLNQTLPNPPSSSPKKRL